MLTGCPWDGRALVAERAGLREGLQAETRSNRFVKADLATMVCACVCVCAG